MHSLVYYEPEKLGHGDASLSTIFDDARTMARNAGHTVRVSLHGVEVDIDAKTPLPRAYLAFASRMEIPTHDGPTRAFLQRARYAESAPGSLEHYVGRAPQLNMTALVVALNAAKMMQEEEKTGADLPTCWHPCYLRAGGDVYSDANLLEPVTDVLHRTWKHGPAFRETVRRMTGGTFENRF